MTTKSLMADIFATQRHSAPINEEAAFIPRLLLVDDEPRLLKSLSELLGSRGFALSTATRGREALRMLVEGNFDLVLLDLRLPDMSGHEIMDVINTMGIDVSVIVISGEIGIDSAIGALQRGAYDYLRKPYSPEELTKRIDNAIVQRQLEARNHRFARQLQHSEKLYRQLIDNSPDIIYMLNGKGQFTFINSRVSQLLGITPEELIGQHFSSLVHEQDIERAHYAFNAQHAQNKITSQIELRLQNRRENKELIFEHSLATIELNRVDPLAVNEHADQGQHWSLYCVARDITQRKHDQQLISFQAHHDTLTTLPNRTLFKDQLSLAIIQAKRSQARLVVMFINLDRFKLVNDTFGHIKGDELLQKVAFRLKDSLRPGDMLARLGGDEFALVLQNLNNDQDSALLAEEHLANLHHLFDLDGNQVHVTASIGLALYPTDCTSADELMRCADIAMNHIKVQGKNAYGFYDDAMLDASQEKITLELSLLMALERNELEMYYQPLVDIETNKIIGAEALMRWNHPERGLLAAGSFIPFAEDNGLILPLSDWMLGAVCQDIQACRALGIESTYIAINVSPQYLDRGDCHEKIKNVLSKYAIDPCLMKVEITENIGIRNPQYAIDQLNQLSELGIGVAIDDFGTGYSSLAYLHRFPIHTIKIDQSFVKEIQAEDGHYPVVLSIISIARGLGLSLVAEGVETETQANYLRNAGCKAMQGYYFYRPMPLKQLIPLLKKQEVSVNQEDHPLRTLSSE